MVSKKFSWKAHTTGVDYLPSIYELLNKPLEAGLWVLHVSKHYARKEYLSGLDIAKILRDDLDISISALSLERAFARAGKKVIRDPATRSYKISVSGDTYLESQRPNHLLNVVYVDPEKPRTAKNNLDALIRSIPKSELLICDPYYGLKTLDVLEAFLKHHKKIRFLSLRIGGGDKAALVTSAVRDFLKEHRNKVEMRIASHPDMHDRYIISDDRFLIVGHGIKDLGSKESMMVVVSDKFGKDIRITITKNFEDRWKLATPV